VGGGGGGTENWYAEDVGGTEEERESTGSRCRMFRERGDKGGGWRARGERGGEIGGEEVENTISLVIGCMEGEV
jgi:hypothetical protein